MATPLSADRLLAALKAEGVKVAERTGWRTHNRNSRGPWGGVNGIVIHHTAGSNSLGLCWTGTTSLPGPLCHTHLAKDGTATMVGHGRANHAGTFAANAHQAVINEASIHPRPDAAEPVDGNQHYYGIEIENLGDGRDPYPAVQYDQAVRWAAAICRAHGWSEHSVIGHKEGTRRKIDPSFPMGDFRAAVAERLAHPASWNPNAPEEEDDMPLTAADAKTLWLTDGFVENPNPASAKTNPYIAPATGLRNIETVARRTEAKVDALSAVELTDTQIATLAAAVAANPALAEQIAEKVAVKLAERLAD
jgi:N-acetylmuramoyl-L-alanine amidase